MDLTAPQQKLIEADERLRELERQAQTDPQSTIAYAVQYLRTHPEEARAAGLNVLAPEDAQVLKDGIKELNDMMMFFSDNVYDDSPVWDRFIDAFPASDDETSKYYAGDLGITGGWPRYGELMDRLNEVLSRI